jgi:LPS export ABC transporter protein LptC
VENKETVLLRNVQATFYENGGGTIIVTGARGRYDTKTHSVEIIGNVHGKSTNGRELFADRLQWTPSSGKVTGSGHIKLLQQRVIMYADQLSSDTTLGQTQFFGHVHAAAR